MKDQNILALIFVCRESLAELEALMAELENAPTRSIDAKLREIEAVATTLSGALDRLSAHMDTIPPDQQPVGPLPPDPEPGRMILAAIDKLFAAIDSAAPEPRSL